jgi:hypothetical protein
MIHVGISDLARRSVDPAQRFDVIDTAPTMLRSHEASRITDELHIVGMRYQLAVHLECFMLHLIKLYRHRQAASNACEPE